MKKFLALVMALLMVISTMAVSVLAAEVDNSDSSADVAVDASGTSGKIYFDASKWNNVSQIYCHLWINGGESFYGWKASQQKCKAVSGSLWEYDLSILDQSTVVSGGLKADEDYCLIFHADTGLQTYNTTFTTACIGDRVYTTDKQIENPMDSNKKAYEALWSKNGSTHGPHFAISSIGNFLGEYTCPHESSTKIMGDWLVAYSGSMYCDATEVMVKAMKYFKVDTSEELEILYSYVKEKGKNSIYKVEDMKVQLEKAYKTVNPDAPVETIPENPTVPADYDYDKPVNGNNGGNQSVSADGQAGNNSGTSNSSGSGADGQNDTIFLILAGMMLLSVGVLVATRRKREF